MKTKSLARSVDFASCLCLPSQPTLSVKQILTTSVYGTAQHPHTSSGCMWLFYVSKTKIDFTIMLSVIFPDAAKTSECKCKVGRWTAHEKFELSMCVFVYHVQLNAQWEYFPNHLKRWGRAQNWTCSVYGLSWKLKIGVNTIYIYIFFLWRCDPMRVMASSFLRFLDHTWHTTVGRAPLDEWSARRRDLYLTTHDTHNRNIHAPGGIRTHDLSRRAACLFYSSLKYIFYLFHCCI
jgi:hypothetical protein